MLTPHDEEVLRMLRQSPAERPLTLACRQRASLAVVQCLVNENPSELRKGYYESDDVPVFHLFYPDSRWWNTPANKPSVSVDVLHYLLEQYPAAVKLRGPKRIFEKETLLSLAVGGSNGRWSFTRIPPPIHFDAVQYLVERYPAALWKKNPLNGLLPLHQLVSKESSTIQVVRLLVKHYPGAARVRCRNGMLALHLACCGNRWYATRTTTYSRSAPLNETSEAPLVPLSILKFLRDTYPDAVNHRDRQGNLPLDVACQTEHCCPIDSFWNYRKQRPSLAFLETLVDLTPATVSGGRPLPVHFAILKSSSFSVIQKLVELDPTSTTVASDEGFVPLQLACGSGATLDVIFFLLRRDPTCLENLKGESRIALKLFLHEVLTLF